MTLLQRFIAVIYLMMNTKPLHRQWPNRCAEKTKQEASQSEHLPP